MKATDIIFSIFGTGHRLLTVFISLKADFLCVIFTYPNSTQFFCPIVLIHYFKHLDLLICPEVILSPVEDLIYKLIFLQSHPFVNQYFFANFHSFSSTCSSIMHKFDLSI